MAGVGTNATEKKVLISQIYFWNKSLHISDSSSAHHQEFRPDPARKLSANLYDIYCTFAVCTLKNS